MRFRAVRWPGVVLALTMAVAGCGGATDGGNGSPAVETTVPGAASTTSASTLQDELRNERVDEAGPDQAFGGDVPADQMTADAAYNYLLTVLKDTDEMWTGYFRSIQNVQSGPTKDHDFYYTIVTDKDATTTCAPGKQYGTNHKNAFFCKTDSATIDGKTYQGQIVLPLGTFMRMWNGDIFGQQSTKLGDFGAAVVVAHEVAHSAWYDLQMQFGLPPINKEGQPRDERNELIADCGAGVWANSAYYKGTLVGTDIEEGVSALEAIGDSGFGGKDPHGTPAERNTAFMLGYNTGKPGQCIAAYWPGVTGG